jgi:hypothetical protein
MAGLLLLYLFAVTVQQDQTVVRAGCGDDQPVVARLAAGTEDVTKPVTTGDNAVALATFRRKIRLCGEWPLPAVPNGGAQTHESP